MCGCHDPGVFGHLCGKPARQSPAGMRSFGQPMTHGRWLSGALARARAGKAAPGLPVMRARDAIRLFGGQDPPGLLIGQLPDDPSGWARVAETPRGQQIWVRR